MKREIRSGPWAPDKGQRCNPAKLLLDPYAKAIEGQGDWDLACFPYTDVQSGGQLRSQEGSDLPAAQIWLV